MSKLMQEPKPSAVPAAWVIMLSSLVGGYKPDVKNNKKSPSS